MKILPLLLTVCLWGCSTSTVEPEPEIEVWIAEVPVNHYSRDPEIYVAIEPKAEADPATHIWTRLYVNGRLYESKEYEPGLIAGHRWYLARNQTWNLEWLAWTDRVAGQVRWNWEKETR